MIRPVLSYMICATPRSGSTLLCEALTSTGIAGRPAEHFEVLLETGRPRRPRDYFQRSNDPDVWALLDDPAFRDILGDYGGRFAEKQEEKDPHWRPPDFEALLRNALERGTTDNGVFGTKIMWAYFRDFVRLARRAGREGVAPCDIPPAVFPNLRGYVWIRREDTVRQAISLWRALQSWEWRREGDQTRKQVPLRYSFAAIDHLRLRAEEHNAAWRAFFERCRIEPVEVVYEEFVQDYAGTVRRVLEGVGITLPKDFSPKEPGMRRQSDELSEEWAKRYHEEKKVRDAP
ncbi:MAG: hypothetical protein IRY88_15375 [Rubrobacteraceae bacterium]|uniref:Stf0 family sulfotransferase n=1 Tax=Rubrobacter calidifluminis TaxID=1392640 RepID=UPI00235E2186|nr:Stf0 family sulfotransferase [Rubrobacter calidifluminis]MBX6765037.1 hypothetical protein [Rubrobacteraceae bacterium]